MTPYIRFNDKEATELAWIHTNRFTTPELFWKKFHAQNDFSYACKILKRYTGEDKGFLQVFKPHPFLPAFYTLTRGAIRVLDKENRILVRNHYPVKINHMEREHDLMVQRLRVAFEGGLQNVFWVSDFELRCGINPPVKHRFEDGELDKEAWRSSWSPFRDRGRRTPDGYFEADMDGKRYGFALELEHVTNPDWKIQKMVTYLEMDYAEETKLVVSATRANAVRMHGILRNKVRASEQAKWFITYLERAVSLPFKKVFHSLTRPIPQAQSQPSPAA